MSAIIDAGVTGLAQLYRRGETDPVAVCDHYLARIAQFDGAIRSFVDIDYPNIEQAAAASAARWAQNHPRSPLDGVPLAVKSNIAVAGLPWSAGVGAYRDRIAATDAQCVALLRKAGAIILGTVNMHEAALGATTDNPWFSRTMNPFRDGYTPGGSSGGSAAAVAAGFCAAALGTDTFGSVRIPASYCGVFGYKPRYGTTSMDGIVPLAPSLDTVGVLARSAADCQAVMSVLGDLPTSNEQPLSIGIAGPILQSIAPSGIALLDANFDPDPFDRFMQPALFVAEAEGAAVYDALLQDPSQALSPGLRKMFGWALKQPPAALAEARVELAAAKEMLSAHINRFGCIITPTTPSVAHRFGEAGERYAARFTLAASLCGVPAIAVPMGVDASGLPMSIQIVGQDSSMILRFADMLPQLSLHTHQAGPVRPIPILANY